MSEAVKPPLGLMPQWCWREHRMDAIEEAIARYEDAGRTVPPQWEQEWREHMAWLELASPSRAEKRRR